MPQSSSRLVWTMVAAAAGLFLAWQAAETLLLIFAGILLSVLLDALTRLVRRFLPLTHGWALALVCTVLAAATGAAVAWSGYALMQEWDQLSRILGQQVSEIRHQLNNLGESFGLPRNATPGGERTLAQMLLPDPGRLLGGAQSAFSAALGTLGSVIVVVLIGVFAAASPMTYRDGVLALVPRPRRSRIAAVLDEMGEVLRWWLVGQLITMAIIGVSLGIVLALLGLPGAVLLALQAALVNFIPYIGPLLAAIPILLTAGAQGTSMLLWVLGAYIVIQAVEGYVLTPLIADRAVNLSPVLTLVTLMLFGALFGSIGVAVATPLAAVIRVAILRLYVDGERQDCSSTS